MDDEIVTPDSQPVDTEIRGKSSDINLDMSRFNPAELYNNPDDFMEMPPSHKRRALTLKQKADIIEAYDQNPSLSKVELARRFNLSRTTLHSIVAKREAIAESMRKFGSYSSMRKKSRTSPFQDIEGKLLMWMEYANELKLPVNGFTLRRQAMAIAKDLGFEKFTASNGWIERFKSRHNDFWKACKSSGTASRGEEDSKKEYIPLEPTIEIKEEPVDYDPTPSTSNDIAHEGFILPHEGNTWTPSGKMVAPQFTLSVASLSPLDPETSDGDQARKKRKTKPSTFVPSTNGSEVRPPSPLCNFGESSNPGSSKELRKDQFDVFGEYIAAKLRSLDRRSCAYAQKAIGDVIFEAEMGKYLDEDSDSKDTKSSAS